MTWMTHATDELFFNDKPKDGMMAPSLRIRWHGEVENKEPFNFEEGMNLT